MTAERPILFTDEMVRAILDGRKTVTRRVGPTWARVQPGTRLWVRECWAPADRLIGLTEGYDADPPSSVVFRADHHAYICTGSPARPPVRADDRDIGQPDRWRPSIHMPRWACRLMLEVVSLTEERALLGGGLGQMAVLMPRVDGDEARREGFADRAAFLALWKKLHPDYTGPVWRVEFRRLP